MPIQNRIFYEIFNLFPLVIAKQVISPASARIDADGNEQ